MKPTHFAMILLAFLVPQVNRADAGCCDRCGATCTTQLVCRTVCTMQIEECDFFDEQCETICMAPKSLSAAGCVGGLDCASCSDCLSCDSCNSCDALSCDSVACDACDSSAGCRGRTPLLSSWSHLLGPSRCHFRDRKQLVRKSYVQYVPKMECIVEELCAGCCGVAPHVLPGDELEPLPAPVVPPEASAPPVRLQISDQPQDPAPNFAPVISADMLPGDEPAEVQALAPIAPVVHSLNR